MKVHKAKLLAVIQYTGDEPKVVRELLTSPLPVVNNGDLLIVPENIGKFLSRAGSPFERVEIEDLFNDIDENYVNHIADDAVATVEKLTQTIVELEGQLKIKQDELEAIELRENQEMEELKKLNQELNDKLENSSKAKKTTTTKATKEETL